MTIMVAMMDVADPVSTADRISLRTRLSVQETSGNSAVLSAEKTYLSVVLKDVLTLYSCHTSARAMAISVPADETNHSLRKQLEENSRGRARITHVPKVMAPLRCSYALFTMMVYVSPMQPPPYMVVMSMRSVRGIEKLRLTHSGKSTKRKQDGEDIVLSPNSHDRLSGRGHARRMFAIID